MSIIDENILELEYKYNKLINDCYKTTKKNVVLVTGDFQCPDSGWGCVICWDKFTGFMWVEICNSGIWDTWDTLVDVSKKWTLEFAINFGIKNVNSVEMANRIIKETLTDEADNYYFGGESDEI